MSREAEIAEAWVADNGTDYERELEKQRDWLCEWLAGTNPKYCPANYTALHGVVEITCPCEGCDWDSHDRADCWRLVAEKVTEGKMTRQTRERSEG
jgi:hypothetical protein